MSILPQSYIHLIATLKDKIRGARQRAVLSVNRELLLLYWEIGKVIIDLQATEGWGSKVIDRLSADLKADFPDFKGLSVRNMKYMSLFAKRFPLFGQQVAAQTQGIDNQSTIIGQQLAAQLPWGHLQVLMDKTSDSVTMLFYMQKCIDNNWSRAVLVEQISTNLYSRQGNAITNFPQTLPQLQSDLAQETFKNPYIFDFIDFTEEIKERELENKLTQHMKKFMLELGRGFAYIGNQKNLNIQGDDFFLDLLFYNYNMHCFVVFELKLGEFKPEYAGKLNFYVNSINKQLKGVNDKPTIGVLLCKTPNETVVRYSLEGIEAPIGVADYQLAQALPKQFKSEILTIEELEAEIDKEYEELQNPSQSRLNNLKQKLNDLQKPELQMQFSVEVLRKIVEDALIPLFQKLLLQLNDIKKEFLSSHYYWSGSDNILSLEQLADSWCNISFLQRQQKQLTFWYYFNGLKKVGTDAFDIVVQLNFQIQDYWYGIVLMGHNNHQPFLKKPYHEMLSAEDIEYICNTILTDIINQIEIKLEYINTQ